MSSEIINLEESVDKKSHLPGARSKNRNAVKVSVPAPIEQKEDELPVLSFAQMRLWFLDQLEPSNSVYNIPIGLRIRGKFEVELFAEAVRTILGRHEVLRTVFPSNQGKPVPKVLSESDFQLSVMDLKATDEENAIKQVQSIFRQESLRPFDLSRGPLFRFSVVRLNATDHVVMGVIHHIVWDGWSAGIFIRELTALYISLTQKTQSCLDPLSLQYRDFARWQRQWQEGEKFQKQLSYWKNQLVDLPGPLPLPFDNLRPRVPSYRGAVHSVRISKEHFNKLKILGTTEKCSPFILLLAAFKTLLYRYTGETDLVVGTPIANRNQLQTEKLIGFFVNTLVLRTRFRREWSFRQLLQQVQTKALDAFDHQDMPFEYLVQEMASDREESHSPIFQVVFIYQNASAESLKIPGMTFEPLAFPVQTAKFDLSLSIEERADGLVGNFEYATDLFQAETIQRMGQHFLALVETLSAQPDQIIERVNFLSSPEQEKILKLGQGTETKPASALTLVDLFIRQVEQNPDNVAVCFGDTRMSYRSLNTRADQLASYLQQLGVGSEVRVGICLENPLDTMIAILGILKAGGAYVPLEPSSPNERLMLVLEDAQAGLLITDEHWEKRNIHCPVPIVRLTGDEVTAGHPSLIERRSDGDLAYVIYTSGSTGKPKGVMVTHANAVYSIQARLDYYKTPVKRLLLLPSFAFDSSVAGIFWTLSQGGTLILPPSGEQRDPASIVGLILQNEVSHLLCLTSLYELCLNEPAFSKAQSLKVCVIGGESCSINLPRKHRGLFPETELAMEYGPTEATIWSSVHSFRDGKSDRVGGIGGPIANTQVYILDQNLELAPLGVTGELCISGEGVTRGYHLRSDLTAERFIPNPFSRQEGARLYRTGDLACFLPDGTIEFRGRMDRQVKLRGFRIEPGEIENVLNRQDGVLESVVAVLGESNERRLVAYVVARSGAKPSNDGLRKSLQKELPEYMVPSAFVLLDRLPLTASGKVDRKALPAPVVAESRADYVEPRNDLERALAGVWSDVLKISRVGIQDNFFELGGHSLLAVQIIVRIRELMGRSVPVRWLFEFPTIARLSEALAGSNDARAIQDEKPLEAGLPRNTYPLSYAQERFWFLQQLEPQSPAYNLFETARIKGPLNVPVFEAALGELFRRHETLRTNFRRSGDEVMAVVNPPEAFRLNSFDFEGMALGEAEAKIKGMITEEMHRPFNLERDILFKVYIFRISSSEHLLFNCFHHIILDDWSGRILSRELRLLYEAFLRRQSSPLLQPKIQYSDFAAWQRHPSRSRLLQEQLGYWVKRLENVPALLTLPTDKPRPTIQTYAGAVLPWALSDEAWQRLRRLSQEEKMTTFMVLLAGFQILLSRYSRQADVVVGTVTANRNRPEMKDLAGLLFNTLALPGHVSEDISVRMFLRQVRNQTLEAFQHSEVPFQQLVQQLQAHGNKGYHPIFQAALDLQYEDDSTLAAVRSDLTFAHYEIRNKTAKFDIRVSAAENQNGHLSATIVEYNTDLFHEETIRRMMAHLGWILEQLGTNPDQMLSEVQTILPREHAQLAALNPHVYTYERDGNIADIFKARCEDAPESLAVVSGSRGWSYQELNENAEYLAEELRKAGVGRGDRVGLSGERSPELIAGMLAILMCDAAYVPLDSSYPADRIKFILKDAGVKAVITDHKAETALADFPGFKLSLSSKRIGRREIDKKSSWNNGTQGRDLAYIMYTSGSTGEPKGILIPHAAVLRLVRNTNYVQLGREDRVAQAATVSFDAATFEIWGALLNGGTVVVLPKDVVLSGQRLEQQIREHGITTMFLTTALFNQIAQTRPEAFASLSHLLFGGEAVDPKSVAQVIAKGKPRRLLHVYGPTEVTTFATWHLVEQYEPKEETIPIGKPIANTTMYVLDRFGNLCPIGVTGELYLGGDGLAWGYLGQPAFTAERFIPNRFQDGGERLYRTGDLCRYNERGDLEFVGRVDHQIKLRGFRIELAEIETAIVGCGLIKQAVVVVDSEGEEKRLVAYVVPKSASLYKEKDLKERLKEALPDYMVPGAFVVMENLPLTPNGKVNRAKLPKVVCETIQTSNLSPRSPTEELLVTIWSGLLKTSKIGIRDNFFELGGHSLLATRLISRVREIFRVDIPLQTIFADPTIAGLAAEIESRHSGGDSAEPLVKQDRQGAIPLSFAQERLWFLNEWNPNSPAYNVSAGVKVKGNLDSDCLQKALDQLVKRHEILRTTFVAQNGQPAQVIHSGVRVLLQIISLSDHLAEDQRDREARRLVQEEVKKPFQLSAPPLCRVLLIRFGIDASVLIYTLHHAIADGWSLAILNRELLALYQAAKSNRSAKLPALAVHYADFSIWERNRLQGAYLQKQVEYWKSVLAGAPTGLALPTDLPRPARMDFAGNRLPIRLSPRLHQQLKEICQKQGVTLYMLLQAAFRVLLFRYSEQADILIGTPVANRKRLELEPVVGLLMNTLVIRNKLERKQTFRECLVQERTAVLGALHHLELPFEKLLMELAVPRDPSRNPLFEVLFTLQTESTQAQGIADFQMENLAVENITAKFDLSMSWMEGVDSLQGEVEYRTSIFRPSTIQRLIEHYQMLLEEIVARPNATISDLRLLTKDESENLLSRWNSGPQKPTAQICLHDWFDQTTKGRPTAIAVISSGVETTYAELKERSEKIAGYLQHRGVASQEAVGVYMRHCSDMVAALLGILKAGAAYVPLDINFPPERLKNMVEEAGLRFILTDSESQPATEWFSGQSLDVLTCLQGHKEQFTPVMMAPESLAYIMFTSGSTGRPKGVQITHHSMINFLESMSQRPGISTEDTVLSLTTLSFDIAGLELFLPLVNGARLVMLESRDAREAAQIISAVQKYQVTLMQATPATWRLLLAGKWQGQGKMKLLCGGEALSRDLADQLLVNGEVWNMYGPTETTVWSLIDPVKSSTRTISIGQPIQNTTVYILDEMLNPTPIGIPGFLYIGGSGLARGYLNRPELTAERFIAHPFSKLPGERLYNTGDLCRWRGDGTIEFLGRRDHQVKIRGHRIELNDIQTALQSCASVKENLVAVWQDHSGDKRLVAYLVLKPDCSETSASLRDFLQGKIPEYMIPSFFVLLQEFPLTVNGKINRGALPVPTLEGVDHLEYIAAQTPTEITLAKIWSDVLGTSRVGLNDNFFFLGGHSLLASQVIARIRQELDVSLPLHALFANPRLVDLAKVTEWAARQSVVAEMNANDMEEGSL